MAASGNWAQDPMRLGWALVIVLAVGFGLGWTVQNWRVGDDLCDNLMQQYRWAVSNEFQSLSTVGTDSGEWEYLRDIYGEDAASQIMEARFSTSRLEGFVAGWLIDHCAGKLPDDWQWGGDDGS